MAIWYVKLEYDMPTIDLKVGHLFLFGITRLSIVFTWCNENIQKQNWSKKLRENKKKSAGVNSFQ